MRSRLGKMLPLRWQNFFPDPFCHTLLKGFVNARVGFTRFTPQDVRGLLAARLSHGLQREIVVP